MCFENDEMCTAHIKSESFLRYNNSMQLAPNQKCIKILQKLDIIVVIT